MATGKLKVLVSLQKFLYVALKNHVTAWKIVLVKFHENYQPIISLISN